MSDDIFDALPKAAPDEWGTWASGKSLTLRDIFPTPEAFKAAANRVWHPFPCVTVEVDENMASGEWRPEDRNAK